MTEHREQNRRTLQRVRIAGQVIGTVVECYVLLEILYYYTRDESLREAVAEWWSDVREWAHERSHIRRTRDMIRDLPECDG